MRVAGRDRGVVPAVVHQELAAARLERRQIRVDGVDDAARPSRPPASGRDRDRTSSHPSSRRCRPPETSRPRRRAPAGRRARRPSRFRCRAPCPETPPRRSSSSSSRTRASPIRAAARSGSCPRRRSLAQQRRDGSNVHARGLLMRPSFTPSFASQASIAALFSIASFAAGTAAAGSLSAGTATLKIPRVQMRLEVRRRAGDDRVEVLRVFLRFHQALPSAGRAAVPVRQPRRRDRRTS